MSRKFDDDGILNFWREQARVHGTSSDASWSDRPVIDMEIRLIKSLLPGAGVLLDVGCANGASTIEYARASKARIIGIDYAPEMIEAAEANLANDSTDIRNRVSFQVGDARCLDIGDETVDAAFTTRVIINLGSWEQQQIGIRECIRACKPGGIVLFSEAYTQGWKSMNAFRAEWGLPSIVEPSQNNYLDQDAVSEFMLTNGCDDIEVIDFSSTYFVGTRVLKPLLAQVSDVSIDVSDPLMHWNHFWSKFPAIGGYGTQRVLFARKVS